MTRAAFLALPFALGLALVAAAPPAGAQSAHTSYSGAKPPDTGGIDPKTDPRVTSVTATLACNCGTCPHEPVSTCTCGTAARLRAEVAAFIAKGQTPEQAKTSMIERYGYEIVARPPFGGLNLIAWVGPFVLIAAAAFLLVRKLSARKAAAERRPAEPAGAWVGANDPYLARVESELRGEG